MSPQQIAHREYLKSSTWQDIRQNILIRDDFKCVFCKRAGYDVHHKTYKNWGHEKEKDLITLCRPCHEQHHFLKKITKKSKSIGTKAMFAYLSQKQKSILMLEFDINEACLYTQMCFNPNKALLDRACKLIGYNTWYKQKR